MKKYLALLSAILCLAGCSDFYIMPTTPPPPAWSGASGLEGIPGTLKLPTGALRVGDTLVEQELRFKRTGVIAETIQLKTDDGKDLILPKGAVAYAMNYNVMRHGPGGIAVVKTAINPIEWCVFLPHGMGGRSSVPDTVCLFWESDNQVRYVETGIQDNTPFRTVFFDIRGTPGPVPVIAEQAVDFRKGLRYQLRLYKLSDNGLIFAKSYVNEDQSTPPEPQDYHRWPDVGNSLVFKNEGHDFVITPAPDYKSIFVTKMNTASMPAK